MDIGLIIQMEERKRDRGVLMGMRWFISN